MLPGAPPQSGDQTLPPGSVYGAFPLIWSSVSAPNGRPNPTSGERLRSVSPDLVVRPRPKRGVAGRAAGQVWPAVGPGATDRSVRAARFCIRPLDPWSRRCCEFIRLWDPWGRRCCEFIRLWDPWGSPGTHGAASAVNAWGSGTHGAADAVNS